ncbi:hypothetical protein C9J03_13375 [Photobacterium gaetbulicola]|uniref:DNA mismatch repair protein n=1 Tax=Photobacterium gaetbulicola Gung47 TaxID=658445 RepID=A0A0C5WMR9_9GAMM|nr:hypothetical protein [Photobacterium gaetbulicola]AJR06354.1 hypothetical protein H744_1c1331 [Photobacterium gaetbulicola Gung47]PSU08709.1 hypothetical protein C9J03_13375 [Photobacterium gaetbulicola]
MGQISFKKWRVPTWTLVAVGLLFNIVSALLTNFYIDDLNRQTNEIAQLQQNNDKLIQLTWQQLETVERKREHLLEVLNAAEIVGASVPEEIAAHLARDMAYWLPDASIVPDIKGVPALMAALDVVQDEHREKINNLYLTNQALIGENAKKTEAVSRLRSLALFLQMLGLALVLARDLNWSKDS